MGVTDMMGQPVQAYRKWNPEDNRYDYAYMPKTGQTDTTGQLTGQENTGLPTAPSWITTEEEYQQWLNENMHYGSSSLGGGQPDRPQGALTPSSSPSWGAGSGTTTYTDEAGNTWTREQLEAAGYLIEAGDPPKEYGDPLDPGKYIDTISPTDDPYKLQMGAKNALMQSSQRPGLLGQGPSAYQLNKPSNLLNSSFAKNKGQLKLGEVRPGLQPFNKAAINAGMFQPPGQKSNWRENAISGLKAGKEVLGLAGAGMPLIGAKGKKQQEQALMKLGTYAGSKALNYGFNKLEDYINAPSAEQVTQEAAEKVITDTAQETAEEGAKEAIAAQSGDLAAEATKAVVPDATGAIAKEATEEAGTGILGAVGKTAGTATSALSAGKDLLGALGSKDPLGGLAKSGLKAGVGALGTMAGSAIAGPVGGLLGGVFGGMGADQLTDAFKKEKLTQSYANMQDPSKYLPEYGDPITSKLLANFLSGHKGRK